jgi:hypothetical protein
LNVSDIGKIRVLTEKEKEWTEQWTTSGKPLETEQPIKTMEDKLNGPHSGSKEGQRPLI